MMALAPNIYWLLPARIIVGFASGLSSVVVPGWSHRRGCMCACVYFYVTVIINSVIKVIETKMSQFHTKMSKTLHS